MHLLAKVVSGVALSAVIIPCLLYFLGGCDLATVQWIALAGTIAWFAATPVWMSRKLPVDAGEVEI